MRRSHQRAFCIIVACAASSGSCTQSDRSTSPHTLPARAALTLIDASAPVVVGAGEIARCDATGAQQTAALLDTIGGTVITLGDEAYPAGSDSAFANCYDPSWGRQKARTRPVAGDLEYSVSGAPGHFAYFGSAAGDRGKGYYSYDVGDWHVVALNSNIDKSAGSAQETWLRADLAANTRRCTLAYWHHPLFWSSTSYYVKPTIKPLWDALYQYGADVVLNAHARNYERFMPQTPAGIADSVYGIREFIVGTGGYDLGSAFGSPFPTSEVRDRSSFGVLKLSLGADGYGWRFVPVQGRTFADSGYTSCHGAPPVTSAGGPYAAVEGTAVAFDGTASANADVEPLAYQWDFGDGSTGTGSKPTHAYAHDTTYDVRLVAVYPGGWVDSARTRVTVANAAPVVSIRDTAVAIGTPVQLGASFTDAGSGDGPWAFTVDWGDSSPAATGSSVAQPGRVAATHSYAALGQYVVRVVVTDVDGAAGTAAANVSVTSAGVTFVGAGDIVRCNGGGARATAALLDGIPGTVFTVGDNAYPATDSVFRNCYEPTWGRHKSRTHPTSGNHDYTDPNPQGYYNYFGAAAGDRAKGYYSYDLGDWHIIVLNSNKDSVATASGSPQELWLRADLAANTKRCTLAMWHHPRFYEGNDWHLNGSVKPFWDDLYASGAEIVLNGHWHLYERYAPQTPLGVVDTVRGIRQFTVGTGGNGHYDYLPPAPNVEVRDNTSYGVLKLTLRSGGYDWQFIPVSGATFTDSGSGTCH